MYSSAAIGSVGTSGPPVRKVGSDNRIKRQAREITSGRQVRHIQGREFRFLQYPQGRSNSCSQPRSARPDETRNYATGTQKVDSSQVDLGPPDGYATAAFLTTRGK